LVKKKRNISMKFRDLVHYPREDFYGQGPTGERRPLSTGYSGEYVWSTESRGSARALKKRKKNFEEFQLKRGLGVGPKYEEN